MIRHDEHGGAIGVVGDGGVGQGDVLRRLALADAHRGERARQQGIAGIGHAGAHLEIARGSVDLRLDRGHDAMEGLARHRAGLDLGLHAHADQIDLALRHGEIDFHRVEFLQRDHGRTRRQILAQVHLADTELAGKRRADRLLCNQRFLCRHLGLCTLECGLVGIHHRLADGLHRKLGLIALERGRGQRRRRFELGQLRFQQGGIELNQRLAGAYPLARIEMDGRDLSADLGTQGRLLTRAETAQCLDGRLPGARLRDRRRNRLRRVGLALDRLADHGVLETLERHHAAHDHTGENEHDDHALGCTWGHRVLRCAVCLRGIELQVAGRQGTVAEVTAGVAAPAALGVSSTPPPMAWYKAALSARRAACAAIRPIRVCCACCWAVRSCR